MQKRFTLAAFAALFIFQSLWAQPPKYNAVEIYSQIRKLNFLGSVLYIAAHPDDENTRLISYFSNEEKARTGYLSLTRGDGGQNLVGPELRELLGVIRTQELIEARKIDGGEQFFTRANDFGYSKNPDETLKIWNRDEVLSDIVYVIRKFRPDVIINRFDARTPGTTHGHHTSSAILSLEAFDKANDAKAWGKQLESVRTWQPKRLYMNTSWWFYGSKEKFDKADKTNLTEIQTGVYYASVGKSNQEIAALSRSSHKSQGFGNTGVRGEDSEFLEFLKGEAPKNKTNIFDGIDTTWNRVKGGKPIGELLSEVEKDFDFKNPSASIPNLAKAYQMIQELDDDYWKDLKSAEIKKIIAACAGLYLEAAAAEPDATPNSKLAIKLEAINRSAVPMQLLGVSTFPQSQAMVSSALENNQLHNFDISINLPSSINYTQPYWLAEKGTVGTYRVDNQQLIGNADITREVKVTFTVKINDIAIPFERTVIYKYNDNVKGEVYQPFDIVPAVTTSLQEKVTIFNDSKPKNISVSVTAGKDNVKGNLQLELPSGWTVSPASIAFSLGKKGESAMATFNVSPSAQAGEATAKAIAVVDAERFDKEQTEINYDHISKQQVLKTSAAKFIRLNIKTGNEKIAYIMGVGDEVPKSLRQMGYDVTLVTPKEINPSRLKDFDVVIIGIRAYNVVKDLAIKQPDLFDFVKNGKTMIVQYNTPSDNIIANIAPFALKLSGDRVTEEDAQVRFPEPGNGLLNFPNTITPADFEGWTQERGLYFPNEWDAAFTPVLSMNDKGEAPKNGSLLVAKFGKGHYIYTGLSFFRELPEGVPGAFRLMANLISASGEK
jgi:LmbE family N-acetylglucosaminyl deacetylase